MNTLEDRTVPAILDLTTGGVFGEINGALYSQVTMHPTGTGVIQSFVRIQAGGTEQGYNTSARPVEFDENTSPIFTHDMLLSNVRQVDVVIGGVLTPSYEFLLDINQTNNRPLLSLDTVEIYQSTTGLGGAIAYPFGASATKVYDMDAGSDSWVALNYSLNAGSGQGDMFLYVPVANFTGMGDNVTLYSHFGGVGEFAGTGAPAGNYSSNDGFEEWAAQKPDDGGGGGGGAAFSISGLKFYDCNADGMLDAGDHPLAGWTIYLDNDADFTNGVVASIGTAMDGTYSFTDQNVAGLGEGTWYVYEGPAASGNWLQTLGGGTAVTGDPAPAPAAGATVGAYTVILTTANPTSTGNNFGNLELGAGGGKTLGFWSNKNGKAQMFDGGSAVPELQLLNSLSLRNADGSIRIFDTTGNGTTGYNQFRTWILNATATNMAYMLSAQLAAMELNVEAGFVNGNSLVYAPGCGDTGVGNNFISITNLMSAAVAQLTAHGNTTEANDPANRAIQECLKDALDDANNNLNFVQPCP